jgi:hypothetical protein
MLTKAKRLFYFGFRKNEKRQKMHKIEMLFLK